MNETKRVMLISSIFPPSWGAGVHRVAKLYKYLPNFGYLPFVLTTKEDSYGVIDRSIDEIFNQGRIMRLRVINWRNFSKKIGFQSANKKWIPRQMASRKKLLQITGFLSRLYTLLSIPDDRVLWIPFAILKGYRTLRRYRIGMLYSTSPHNSCHVVALFLHRLTGIPWISDFRDPWVGNPFLSSKPRIHTLIENVLETQVIRYSSKVVSISKPITRELKKRHPDVSSSKFNVLPNSFDPDDFVDIREDKDLLRKFTISHAGTFYGERSPGSFLRALIELFERKPSWRNRIEVFFIGSFVKDQEVMVLIDSLKDVVRFIDHLPYRRMLSLLVKSSLVLLIPGPGEGTVTGKVFDYLGLKKPIFLLSQGNTVLENILRETKSGFILPYGSIESIVESLTSLIQEFFDNGTIKMEMNEEEINHYTSIEMTKKFSKIMDELLNVDKGRFMKRA